MFTKQDVYKEEPQLLRKITHQIRSSCYLTIFDMTRSFTLMLGMVQATIQSLISTLKWDALHHLNVTFLKNLKYRKVLWILRAFPWLFWGSWNPFKDIFTNSPSSFIYEPASFLDIFSFQIEAAYPPVIMFLY